MSNLDKLNGGPTWLVIVKKKKQNFLLDGTVELFVLDLIKFCFNTEHGTHTALFGMLTKKLHIASKIKFQIKNMEIKCEVKIVAF